MFGHYVVDDFKEFLSKPGTDPMYCDAVRSAVEGIKQAQHFYLGEYQELMRPLKAFAQEQMEKEVFLGSSAPYCRLPYSKCWLEFEDKSFDPGSTLPVPKRGILVEELERDLLRVVTANWIEELKRWMLTPQCYMVLIGKRFIDDIDRTGKAVAAAARNRGASVALVDTLLKSNIFPIPTSKRNSWEDSVGLRGDDQRDLFVLNAALLLLNCKNVCTENNEPPPKLNKKRAKTGKQELFRFKTLKLNLPATRQVADENAESGDGGKTKIHLCRGHFKIFTEEAPLFGKYTGLYWWDAHLRGEKTKGMLVKDYAVTPVSSE